MTDYIKALRDYYIINKTHHTFRQQAPDKYDLALTFMQQGLSDIQRASRRFCWVLKHEKPVVLKNEKIVMLRTIPTIPEIFAEEEFSAIKANHYIHEQGKVCNINPLYSIVIDAGFDSKRQQISDSLEKFRSQNNEQAVVYLLCTLEMMDAIEEFIDRYRMEALRVGNLEAADTLARVPRQSPRNFREALQFFRILHYCLWCCFNYHNTIGRFDQFMYPYFKCDMENGKMNEEGALELIEELFITFSKDSDLYNGMQQGDNGQSMVLGGLNEQGVDTYNELSDLCLQASLELNLIDPKINLRVSSKTPLSLYEKATYLTKQGLGFPQYSNDDIVIESLKRWGYAEKDAYNYVVAACWEFIIPGVAMDIPNIDSLSFPKIILKAMKEITQCDSFEEFLQIMRMTIIDETRMMCERINNLYMEPAPIMSLMMEGCIENGRDISFGSVYNNYGFHGAGLSTAVDSLAAIKKYIYEDKFVSKDEIQDALDNNFDGYDELWRKLRYDSLKMGNDNDDVDRLATQLLDWFADAMEGGRNDRGGIFKAGTGSAMYYIWQSQGLPATPDGRKKGEAFACNYSPSLFNRCNGPFSIIKSFTKPHLVRVCNGGPLTIEFHDTLFRNADSIQKVAMFVKTYFDLGGHQIQVNSVNRKSMTDAKIHPENHRNLIVRVWGWSGYFVELNEVYQDHIISRNELT